MTTALASAASSSASPTSILHLIRSSPPPPQALPAHSACPTCHHTPSPAAHPHPQTHLSAYSLYSHGLSSASPPAMVFQHSVLPSPPPLLPHVSIASQHSAASAQTQWTDASYILAAMPPSATTPSSTASFSHFSHARPSLAVTPTTAASQAHLQSHYPSYPYSLTPHTVPSHAHPAASSPHTHAAPYPAFTPPQPHNDRDTLIHHHFLHPHLYTQPSHHRHRTRHSHADDDPLAHLKTEICRTHFLTGQCQFGSDCQFAHSFTDLRPREYDSKYKTELCKRYHTLGASGCKFGVRCKFLHDEVRVKAGEGEYWLCSEVEGIVRVEVVPSHHFHRRQLLDQLTYYPPSGPVSPLSTSPIRPTTQRGHSVRRGGGGQTLASQSFAAAEYSVDSSGVATPMLHSSLAALPAFLSPIAAVVSPAHSTRSVPVSVSGMDSTLTSTLSQSTGNDSSGSGDGEKGLGGGSSYSVPVRYRRVGDGEYVLSGERSMGGNGMCV